MKLNILHIIYLINYVVTFPIFDELWETNQTEPQANNNPIESQPKIKVEPHDDGRWQDESALKRNVKVENEPDFGAVKVEGKDKIKHEFEWWGKEIGDFKEKLEDRVKEEDQDGQDSNTSDHKKIGDDDEYWEEDEEDSAPTTDDLDQENSNKHLSDQNNSTDQDESVDEQRNEFNEYEKIESDQQKRKIIQKFHEIKDDFKMKRKYSTNEWVQIERNISNGLGVDRTTLYKWKKEFGFSVSNKKFSEFEKRKILKQFDEIKSKCKQANLKILNNYLDKKIANKIGVSISTITNWKHKFGLSVSKKKFSDATKIEILKKYAKIKGKNPKMRELDIADLLKISGSSLKKWKAQFRGRN